MFDSLDTIVLKTLDFYAQSSDFPRIPIDTLTFPLVVGSGNGIETGKILFRRHNALIANESDAVEKLGLESIREVVVVSASGEKHAPILVQKAKDAGKRTLLISSTKDSSASRIADESYIFPKITEPYTYNTSTYFGYIYGSELGAYTPQAVQDWIHTVLAPSLKGVSLDQYNGFVIVLPNSFALLKDMISTKFIELFGRRVARDIATYEQMKHAITVVPSETELFLCFGNEAHIQYGAHQIDLPVFDTEHYGPMMLAAYWVVGQIQNALPPYFKEHLVSYCEHAHYPLSPIVPGESL